jgi:signal transduction histidine kinase
VAPEETAPILPAGLEVGRLIRVELARRWNRLRLLTDTVVLMVAVGLWFGGSDQAGVIVGIVALAVLHGLYSWNRNDVTLSLALDIIIIFMCLELAGVDAAALAVTYMSLGVIVILLCGPVARVVLVVLASVLCLVTIGFDLAGNEMLTSAFWSTATSWPTALIMVLVMMGAVNAAIDLLQQKTKGLEGANRRLEELVASKEDLIAAISHQIRTPLAGVLGFAAELEDQWESFSVGERREMAGDIVALSAEIENITEDLTVAARRDLGTLVVRHESVELLGEIEGFAQQCRHADGIVVAGERCEVEVDRLRLRQVLRSLVSNAVAHGGDRVWLEVASVPDGGMVRVCDDGDGIPEAYRDQMFAPYERLQRHSTLPASMGLGLTIARGLSEVMGGTLTYRRAGGVSFFELTLPHAHQPLTRHATVPAHSQVA